MVQVPICQITVKNRYFLKFNIFGSTNFIEFGSLQLYWMSKCLVVEMILKVAIRGLSRTAPRPA